MTQTMTEWERARLGAVKPFCDIMRHRRRATGVSLKHLSDLVGVSKTHLHMLERGTTTNPSVYIVYKIANVLSLDFHECCKAIAYQNALREYYV